MIESKAEREWRLFLESLDTGKEGDNPEFELASIEKRIRRPGDRFVRAIRAGDFDSITPADLGKWILALARASRRNARGSGDALFMDHFSGREARELLRHFFDAATRTRPGPSVVTGPDVQKQNEMGWSEDQKMAAESLLGFSGKDELRVELALLFAECQRKAKALGRTSRTEAPTAADLFRKEIDSRTAAAGSQSDAVVRAATNVWLREAAKSLSGGTTRRAIRQTLGLTYRRKRANRRAARIRPK